jgi:nicotinic acid mononucleotide adenylyltransferase
MDCPALESLRGFTVAFFGLSANPPTGLEGHLGVVRSLVQCGKFSEVWIVPVYVHVFSSKRNLESFEDRCRMCKVSMDEESTTACVVRVLNVEKVVSESFLAAGESNRPGTIDVIEHLYSLYQNKIKIELILGSDTLHDLLNGKWKESKRYSICLVLNISP